MALGNSCDLSYGALLVANSAARRYYRRAVLFAGGQFEKMRDGLSLLDPQYPTLTSANGLEIL